MAKASHGNDVQKKEKDPCLQERLAKWRQEQYRVAKEVVIAEDNAASSQLSKCGRYQVKSLHQYSDRMFGGVDVSFPEIEGDPAIAVYCIVHKGEVVYHDHEIFDLTVPYVSSYLSFREIDPLERLVKKQMRESPDLTPHAILVDGNGVLHKRQAGIACFLGVRTGIKTIGVGKTLYCHAGLSTALVKNGIDRAVEEVFLRTRNDAEFKAYLQKERGLVLDSRCIDASAPNAEEVTSSEDRSNTDRGSNIKELAPLCGGISIKLMGNDGKVWASALLGHGGQIGAGRATKTRGFLNSGTKNPIFVSVGHLVSLDEAVRICAELSRARIPEPVRQADLSGRKLLRDTSRSRNKSK